MSDFIKLSFLSMCITLILLGSIFAFFLCSYNTNRVDPEIGRNTAISVAFSTDSHPAINVLGEAYTLPTDFLHTLSQWRKDYHVLIPPVLRLIEQGIYALAGAA